MARAKAAALAIPLFLLANCATSKAPPKPAGIPDAMTSTPQPVGSIPSPPTASTQPTPETDALAVMPAPVPAPPPAPPPPPPTDAQTLRAAYGAPDFIRREMGSELWRYDGKACAVFFFLYREGNELRIRYTETNPRGKESPADTECMRGLNERVPSRAASMRMS